MTCVSSPRSDLHRVRHPVARAIASNPGHCLATGIADSDVARRIADRLLADDMFSGWGIRTLSKHPAYNPYSYHRGSIWPVEQGTFALGKMRYGLHEHMHRIVEHNSKLRRPHVEASPAGTTENHFITYPYCARPLSACLEAVGSPP